MSVSSMAGNYKYLFYQALTVVIMQECVLQHALTARVGVAVDTEVAARVIHTDILAYHAAAYLALSFILHIPLLVRQWW